MNKLSKLCALLLALCVCMSVAVIPVSADAPDFKDVKADDYFYPAVQWGVEAGVTDGIDENSFAPDGEVTRAQVATFLWRMAGQPAPTVTETFKDVEAGSWYETAVRWAVENEITNGTGDGMFSPDAICDRAMCITLLYRMVGSPLDGIDLSAEIEFSDDMSTEDYVAYLTNLIIKGVREEKPFSDVGEGDYFELPVVWASLVEVITADNTEIGKDKALFQPNKPCVRKEMISFLYQTKLAEDAQNAPAEIYFDEYTLQIPQEYLDFVAFEAFVDGDDTAEAAAADEEVLVTMSELASKQAAEAMGEDADGIGELFRIVRVTEERLHSLLCSDMSGVEPLAKDEKGRYYLLQYPTDVRYMRENNEKMAADIEQWTMLNEWAREEVPQSLMDCNEGLYPISFTNTQLDMYLARIAYDKDVKYTISTNEFGPLEPKKLDGTRYAEYLLEGNFAEVEDAEAPDGEYVVLNFPDDKIRYDFFTADENLVREVNGDNITLYKRVAPGSVTNTEAMQSWYYAIAEQVGKKKDYKELDPFIGEWAEEIAGRGAMTITKSVGLAKADIEVRWAGSAAEVATWSITANLAEDGALTYSNGKRTVTEYDENGHGTVISEVTDESGTIALNKDGKLIWKTNGENEESTFVRAK